MQYFDFQGEKISRLGFGTMRLPMKDGAIDQAAVQEMTDYAIAHGVNYFDTAYPYMSALSEFSIGEALSAYPRERFFLADKFPGHQIRKTYEPEAIFEEQLKKCGVEYFDFYLLHNVYEGSIATYEDPRWGMIDYFVEQKKNGRIRHLGFSSHAGLEALSAFLDRHGEWMEFCQIQLNYLDWTLQDASSRVEMLRGRGVPIWVMEPVRGGRLADLGGANNEKLRALRPKESIASWAMRWVQAVPGTGVILSGMSNLDQMKDNVATFSGGEALSGEETKLLLSIAEEMKGALPCTGCRYCCDGCPMGLDIPRLLATYNDMKFSEGVGFTARMLIESLPEEKRPSACIGCGQCAAVCPQKIDIPAAMRDLVRENAKLVSWSQLSAEREKVEEAVRRR